MVKNQVTTPFKRAPLYLLQLILFLYHSLFIPLGLGIVCN